MAENAMLVMLMDVFTAVAVMTVLGFWLSAAVLIVKSCLEAYEKNNNTN